jgi:hypothetical protein
VLLSSTTENIIDRSTITVKTFIHCCDLPLITGPDSTRFFDRMRAGLPDQNLHAIPVMAVSSIEGSRRRVLEFLGEGGGAFFAKKGLPDANTFSIKIPDA